MYWSDFFTVALEDKRVNRYLKTKLISIHSATLDFNHFRFWCCRHIQICVGDGYIKLPKQHDDYVVLDVVAAISHAHHHSLGDLLP